MDLARAFVDALPDSVEGAGSLEARLDEIQTAIDRTCTQGALLFEFELDPLDLARYLARRTSSVDAIESMSLEDLYLACACSQGLQVALDEFVRRFGPEIKQALRQLPDAIDVADEIAQSIFDQLLLPDAEGRRGIESYRGRGSLFSWLRVVAIRRGLRELKRQGKNQEIDEERIADQMTQAPDLGYMKEVYRDAFRKAFSDTLAELDLEARRLLRHHYLHGLSIDKLAALHEIHRATAARRIARAREGLLQGTRRRLLGRLRITSEELDSIMALIESRLDASLGALMSSVGE